MYFTIDFLMLFFSYKLNGTQYHGISCALLFSVLIYRGFWRPYQGDDLGMYKYWKHERNPLFVKGYFRKGKKRRFLSELKGLYWTQMLAAFELVAIWVYGIGSVFVGCNRIIQEGIVIFTFALAFIHIAIEVYYSIIIDRTLKKRKWLPYIKAVIKKRFLTRPRLYRKQGRSENSERK